MPWKPPPSFAPVAAHESSEPAPSAAAPFSPSSRSTRGSVFTKSRPAAMSPLQPDVGSPPGGGRKHASNSNSSSSNSSTNLHQQRTSPIASPSHGRSSAWAPPFVVGTGGSPGRDAAAALPAGADPPFRSSNGAVKPPQRSASLIQAETPASDCAVQPPSNGGGDATAIAITAGGDEERRLSLRQNKMETLIVDRTMMQTRLEWNQLLVNRAFRPYREKICSMDENLPSPQDIATFEDESDDFYVADGKEDIRGLMLDDPDLSEREIAAFFEGMRLVQVKVNSLQSQLDGLKAMQRMTVQQVLETSSQRVATAQPLNRSATMVPAFPNGASLRTRASVAVPVGAARLPSSESEAAAPAGEVGVSVPAAPPAPRRPTADAGDATRQQNPRPVTSTTTRDYGKGKSLRAMSIARIRTAVDAMDDVGARKVHAGVGGTNKNDTGRGGANTETHGRGGDVVVVGGGGNGAGSSKEEIQRLLVELEEAEKYQKKLEKQLAQAGMVIAEDIPYDVAKLKVQTIALRMAEIGGSDAAEVKLREEYFRLEQDMEKYTTALQLTDEWAEEQAEMDRQWESSVAAANEVALRKVRRHMPVNVRNLSEAALSAQPTPNGRFLPQSIAKKFKRTNILLLLRIDPAEIVPMHPSTLENMRVTGLTLTERRALYVHLKDVGPRWKAMQSDKMTERKWNWFNMMRSNFKETVDSWQRHVDQYGPPGSHPRATREHPHEGCPLIGKQCPLEADKLVDYDGDYGFPEGAVYFKSETNQSDVNNASKAKHDALALAREKKESERSDALKKHYRGKILQVSLANGSCEAMDEAMEKMEQKQEKWIREQLSDQSTGNAQKVAESAKNEVAAFNDALNELKLSILQFAERSGMQLTGKRDANADQDDTRSMVELGLCEEVVEWAANFFKGIDERMNEIQIRDGRMKSTIQQLTTLLDELHERNTKSIARLSATQERPQRSRELRSRKAVSDEICKELREANRYETREEESPSGGTTRPPACRMPDNRGDLMAALQGRAGRHENGNSDSGGRSDLMAALQGRAGRHENGNGNSDSGGRSDLMAALQGRAGRHENGNGNSDSGDRSDLMAALKGERGRGHGDLISAAIEARGRGGDAAGGRGGLMAAIAARGTAN